MAQTVRVVQVPFELLKTAHTHTNAHVKNSYTHQFKICISLNNESLKLFCILIIMLILQVLQVCTSSIMTSLSWGGRGSGGDAHDISH